MVPPLPSASSRYTIGREIGRGGMGIVYEATDVRLGRKVAVKILPESEASSDRKRRFVQEAQAASSLNHPNIVTIHDVDSADGVEFIVMEYVDGTPLHRVIPATGLPLNQALDYARQVTSALAAAHGAGIVHRDLKPSNIMVGRDGRIKILDFGLSKLTRPTASSTEATQSSAPETVRGIVMGSAGYMSPEQAMGEAVDVRSDVFSLGVLLFEMVSGTLPFPANDVRALLHDPPKSLLDARPDTPPALVAAIVRCLEKDPAKRYNSSIDLHQEVEKIFVRQAAASRSPSRGWLRPAAMVALPLIIGTAGLTAWFFVARARSERELTATVSRVEQLVDAGRFVEVWRAAGEGLRRWPNDTRLQQALQASTHVVTIATDPSGADVMFKAYTDVEGEWIPLGTTPLNGVRAPLGMLRWKIVKPAFEPVEARLEVGVPAAAAGRPDVAARPIRLHRPGEGVPGAVLVPGGQYMGRKLPDFWIDRTEVTNQDFKRFVDRGGYQNPALWPEPGVSRFRDRTGQPGPSAWELGGYTAGQQEHPVQGVSWFEAAAYCASLNKVLPSVFHWRKAFGETFFMEVVTLGNFGGRGVEPVGRLQDLGPYGTLGMAGNVKEWIWNDYKGKRYILGGGWNEPVYMATNDDTRPPLDRGETNGFRCIKETASSEASVFASWASPQDSGSGGPPKPVTETEYRAFRRFFEYDRTALESKVESMVDQEYWRRERVSFAAAYGNERVLANILLPKNARPPFQAVIWFPGSYALDLTSTAGDLPFSLYFDFVARSGRALVYPVYSDMYERLRPASAGSASPGIHTARDQVVRWAKDFSRTVDYLESRGDIDVARIAYYGYSLGGAAPLSILATEERLKAAILLAAGLYPAGALPPEVDPVNFVSRAELPLLMLGGRNDFVVPVETSQKPLFELFGTPAQHKRHVVFEDGGHVPPRIQVIREVLDWLDRYLGPVRR